MSLHRCRRRIRERVQVYVWVVVGLILSLVALKATGDTQPKQTTFSVSSDVIRTAAPVADDDVKSGDDVKPDSVFRDANAERGGQERGSPTPTVRETSALGKEERESGLPKKLLASSPPTFSSSLLPPSPLPLTSSPLPLTSSPLPLTSTVLTKATARHGQTTVYTSTSGGVPATIAADRRTATGELTTTRQQPNPSGKTTTVGFGEASRVTETVVETKKDARGDSRIRPASTSTSAVTSVLMVRNTPTAVSSTTSGDYGREVLIGRNPQSAPTTRTQLTQRRGTLTLHSAASAAESEPPPNKDIKPLPPAPEKSPSETSPAETSTSSSTRTLTSRSGTYASSSTEKRTASSGDTYTPQPPHTPTMTHETATERNEAQEASTGSSKTAVTQTSMTSHTTFAPTKELQTQPSKAAAMKTDTSTDVTSETKTDSVTTQGHSEGPTTEEALASSSSGSSLVTTAGQEKTVTSTTAKSTTDCVEAIKVDGLRVVTAGTNNVTLTWRQLTSRSKGVYHVKVTEQSGGEFCVQYTLESSPESKFSDKGRQPRKREDCQTTPEKLVPSGDQVVIPELKVCTAYDVTVTSECGACPCDDRDTSASVPFSTDGAAPGPVSSLQVYLNETDIGRVVVSWKPPSYPTCGVNGYLCRLLRDDDCLTEIRLLAVGAAGGTRQGDEKTFCKNSETTHGSLTSPEVVFNDLLPDTDYTLNVIAINDVGTGLPVSRPVHTLVAVPSSPTSLVMTMVTSDSVTLEWTVPEPRPGPTTYSVHVLDMGSPYLPSPLLLNTTSRYCGTGYETTSCLVTGLRPYWTYNFTLTAHTGRGDSPPAVLSELVITESTAPGHVTNLTVEAADDSFTAVRVTWNCPALEDRNARMVGYLVRSVLVLGKETKTDDVKHLTTADCDVINSLDFYVTPERHYTFQVKALGENYNATQWTTVSYFAPPGPSEAVSSVTVEELGAENVTVQWSVPAVTNGQLTAYGLRLVDSVHHTCVTWLSVPLERSTEPTPTGGPWADCVTRDDGDVVTFVPGNQAVSLTLRDLPPDTSLTLIVYPGNNAGWGHPANVSFHTLETVPSSPTHITAWPINATALAVTWTPREPRAGATNYTVVLHRATGLDNTSLTFLASTTITVIGWSRHKAVVSGLWSGWRYSITLRTSTSVGSRAVQLDRPIEMPQSPPGKVQNLSVLAVANDYRHVQVTWDYPRLKDRNGVIVSFTICWQAAGSYQEKCRSVQQPWQQTAPQFCATVDVTPGHGHTLKVRANNKYSGVPYVIHYKANTGPPPALGDVGLTSSVSTSQSTFGVFYCAPCLLNATNGEITFIALLVCHDPYCQQVNSTALSRRSFIETLPSWKRAKGNNFRDLYRPTGDAWIDTVRTLVASGAGRVANRSAGGVVYTIGEDEGCVSRDEEVHCNGPLPSGQSFRVTCVSCTSASCTASAFSPSALTETASLDPDVTTPTVIGSATGLALGLVVIVLFLSFRHRRRRRVKSKRSNRREAEGEELTDMTHSHRAVTIQDFGDKLREWKAVVHPDSGLPMALVQQFAEMGKAEPSHKKSAAVLEENFTKNRYTNILPYDHSRVKLVQMDDDVTTDYINANYIPGFHSRREYIATQGPVQRTVNDLWRMVWEQRCPLVIMLSGLAEGRLNKVYKYFPDEDQLHQPVRYGLVTVTLQNVQPHEDYLVRTFLLSVGQKQQEVKQFLMDSWRDFRANLTPSHVLDFVRAVRREVPDPPSPPLVVHCSAGVGRTGTWIAIDYFMQYIHHSPPSAPLNIRDFVMAMRDCRAHMVQSLYVFIHEAVAELVRRKMEVDRYDEPALSGDAHYANAAFERDSDEPSSSTSRNSDSNTSNNTHTPTTPTHAPSPLTPSNVIDVTSSRL
ncbi:receptor-type tyrosine-protein phosphatase F-like isoform X2 [Babylonia areolata]|uniref:receptor-type tyrosine-protein phosphatase F-like isoform X2 n=1 Tax=Babylonia areolata TaxID=304850 RepID=UPI003FCFF648